MNIKIEISSKRSLFSWVRPLTPQKNVEIMFHITNPIINILKTTLIHSINISECIVIFIKKHQKLMDICAPQVDFFPSFYDVYWKPCFCLTLLPQHIGWEIMWCEPEPLPSHRWIKNYYYKKI